ncbi:MAG: SRPBCC domain-containing protein [Maribacter sp.]
MEKAKNYQLSVTLNSTKKEAFNALTKHIPDWWSTVDGSSEKEGDEFKVSFGTESYWKFKVIAINNPDKIVWECIESHQNHNLVGIDEEWINTKLYWTISNLEGKTKVDFLHDGLLSTGVCYEVCSNGWDFYISDSLKQFLEKGEGKPSRK